MNAVKIEDVSKEFSGHRALHKVSFEVPEKGIFGLLGPNGAGKTTLIRIINQITAPDEGKISFFGKSLSQEHISQIGYLPEERGLYRKMKVGEQAIYLARLKGLSGADAKKRLSEWFERFEITDWWDKKVEELSKGMAQKIQFITTVMHEPRLLILDEPFSGFDPINVELIRNEMLRLRDNGATIMLSTHDMNSVEELCENIALINKSELVLSGSVSDIRNQFDHHAYRLVFEGNMISFTNALWTNFELTEKSTENNIHECEVRLLNGKSLNDLLQVILPQVELLEVEKIKPRMRDIFVEAVNGEEKEEVSHG